MTESSPTSAAGSGASRINEAYGRVLASDVRHRFAIDTATI
ncbi:hypothetical protein ACWCQM_33645 [Streptomyces sp. NPDC002125]